MSSSALAVGLRQLRSKLAARQRSTESDEQLLHAYTSCRDDNAFAVMVQRHGSMVLRVCRRTLGNEQDAEDAFQATFLVLAQSAAALRSKASLAGFLHGTAYRIAMKAKQTAARRRKHEVQATSRLPIDPADDLSWREVRVLLDEEIARLPETYRSVFVLCHLEDVSRAEAAQRLGLKECTVLSRLATARKRLAQRLARRGVELTAVLAAVALAAQQAAALPAGLTMHTIAAASATAAGERLTGMVSASVIELARSATAAMIVSKAKVAAVVLLAVMLLGGAGVWAYRGLAAELPTAAADDKPKAASPQHEMAKTEQIQGRVLGPDEKPVKGAHLYWPRTRKDATKAEYHLEMIERGRSDDEGRFRIFLAANEELHDSIRQLVVTAASYGLTWIDLPKAKSSEKVMVRLRKDVTIQGRIVSTEGRPLAGVRIDAERLEEMPNGRLDDYLVYWKQDWNKALRLKTQQLNLPPNQAIVLSTITDATGRFQLSGVGSERIVHLKIRGEGIAHTPLPIVARHGFDPAALNKSARNPTGIGFRMGGQAPVLYGPSFDYVALPSRLVEGIVREIGTGKPIAGVRIRGSTDYRSVSDAITDKEGRYRLEGLPKVKSYSYVHATPQGIDPWLFSIQGQIEGGEGLQPVRVDFALGRGVAVTGRVIDRATGKGVKCSVMFNYLPDNKFIGKPGYEPFAGSYASDDEGRFRLKVVPGTGVLEASAMGAINPFKPAQFDAEDRKHITFTQDGDFVAFPGSAGFLSLQNAVKRLDLAPDAGVVEQDLYLERGAEVKVRIQDSEGKPLSGVIVAGIDAMPGHHLQDAYVAPKAECRLVALAPQHPRHVIFYHMGRRLAGTLEVRGDEKEPLTVRLAPTGAVIGCLKDADGQPLQGVEVTANASGPITSTNLSYLYLHLNHTRLHVITDKQGRFRLEGVVPGEKVAVSIRRRGAALDGGSRTRGIQVKAGETLDLGDIVTKPVR